MIALLWLYLFGKFECRTHEKALRLHSYLVKMNGNIVVNYTKLELKNKRFKNKMTVQEYLEQFTYSNCISRVTLSRELWLRLGLCAVKEWEERILDTRFPTMRMYKDITVECFIQERFQWQGPYRQITFIRGSK